VVSSAGIKIDSQVRRARALGLTALNIRKQTALDYCRQHPVMKGTKIVRDPVFHTISSHSHWRL